MNAHHYGLILAGGRGTRFWPRSRKRTAKQVLNVAGERTLIQATVDRLAPVIPPERLWVLTNEHLRDVIIEAAAGDSEAADSGRARAAQYGAGDRPRGADSAFAGSGSGHGRVSRPTMSIGKPGAYRTVVKAAFKGAAQGKMMVVGIQPRWPETGYGYVEFPTRLRRRGELPRR